MASTPAPFSFPKAHFLLFVFLGSTVIHLQQRIVKIQSSREVLMSAPAARIRSQTQAPSRTPSPRPSPSPTASLTLSPTPNPSLSPTASLTLSSTPSLTPSPSPSPEPQGMFTINAIGRLGNQMGQYATLYALAKMNGRPAYIPAAMHSTLAPIFRISLPVLHSAAASRIPWQNYHLNDWMEERYRRIPGRYVRLTGYPCSWTFYHHLRAEIRREFALHEHVRRGAQAFLSALRVRGARPAAFVGVHVRRGDYVQVMPQVWKGVVADRGYLAQALDWFRARWGSPVFVVTSNGMAWCRENIDASRGDVVFAGDGVEGSPAKDFALLTQCNHTIMTIGTFGIWAAYLAGGETVYLANYTLPTSPFLKIFKPEAAFLPEWKGIAADLSPLLTQGV